MTSQTKQKYTAEFKENAVKRANESSNVAETARELGIKENTLTNWFYQYSRPLKPDKAVRTDEHLYDELKRRCAFDGGARFVDKAAAYPSLYSGQAVPEKYGSERMDFGTECGL